MNETKLEHVEASQTDKPLNGNRGANAVESGSRNEPTERQIGYIQSLAQRTGLQLDVSKIRDRDQASRMIAHLKLLNARMNGNRFRDDGRNRKVAFGMATKLIFRRYSEQQKDPTKWKRFWRDVHSFYDAYQEQQELAVVGDEYAKGTV